MSETILDHGWVPEEHAPDPVIGHGDPTPPGKVAIWLFLASEVMFFIGLLATYIIFRSGSPAIFGEHAQALSKTMAGINTLVLIFSSLTMALAVDAAQKGNVNRLRLCLALTIACAFGFMGIKYKEYKDKLTHHTIVTHEGGKFYVYDGHATAKTYNATTGSLESITLAHAYKAERPPGTFDIHWMSAGQVEKLSKAEHKEIGPAADPSEGSPQHGEKSEAAHKAGGHGADYTIPAANISQDITYGPWKNIFYACYFSTTGVHGLHVVGGIVALGLLLGHALRGNILPAHTEYIGLYWHFVDLVWIFLFPLLYLI